MYGKTRLIPIFAKVRNVLLALFVSQPDQTV